MSKNRFNINGAVISHIKLPFHNEEDGGIDIAQSILEINLYEDITKPYITGTLLVLDDFGYLNNIRPRGTERLYLEISTQERESTIARTFVIDGVQQINYDNERRRILTLSICDEMVYFSALKKVEKSYTDAPWVILMKIMREYLGVDCLPVFGDERSSDKAIKVIIPGLSPLQSIEWLRDRCTTSVGLPMYCYAKPYFSKPFLTDLHQILDNNVVNIGKDFTMSRTGAAADPQNQFDGDNIGTQIMDANFVNLQDNMKQILNGAISGTHTMIDTSNALRRETVFSMRDLIRNIYNKQIPLGRFQSIFDPLVEDDRWLSSQVDQIHSSGTYVDEYGYYDSIDNGDNYRRMACRAINSSMQRNVINIVIPGEYCMSSRSGVGDRFNLRFINSSQGGVQFRDRYDKVLSGEYIALQMKHVFNTSGSHGIHAKLTKLSDYDGS